MSRIGQGSNSNIQALPTQDTQPHAVAPRGASCDAGLPPGTQVLTLDGAIPVEFLNPGDRVITRSGARTLQSITRHTLAEGSQRIRVAADALGGKPTGEVVLLPGQRVVVRDWRARTLWGADMATVPLARLVDGQAIRIETGGRQTMLSLYFGTPEILYANGLELASADMAKVDTAQQ